MIGIILGVFEAFWRRWFGGCSLGGERYKDSWFNKRAFQHTVGALFLIFIFYKKGVPLLWNIYAVLIIQGLFWAKGHPSLDMGRKEETAEDKKRYEEVWFAPIVRFLVPACEAHRFGYDFIWHSIRYMYPGILLMPVFGGKALIAGVGVAWIYAAFASLYERIGTEKLPSWINRANKASEIAAGFLAGLMWGM